MITTSIIVKEASISTIELIKTIDDILRGVRMDKIQIDDNTKSMSLINELFELIGRTISTRGGKEARHLVTKTSIVGVLHDGH